MKLSFATYNDRYSREDHFLKFVLTNSLSFVFQLYFQLFTTSYRSHTLATLNLLNYNSWTIFSALHGVKRTVLDRISKLEFTDDDEKLQNKSYAATILCCLGDCMEIFIKSKTSSTTTLKDSSRGSSPAAIDVGSKRSSDVESEKLCESR